MHDVCFCINGMLWHAWLTCFTSRGEYMLLKVLVITTEIFNRLSIYIFIVLQQAAISFLLDVVVKLFICFTFYVWD